MKNCITLFICLLLLSVGCKKAEDKTTYINKPISLETPKPDINKNYWHLEGTVGDKKIAMELVRYTTASEVGGAENNRAFSGYYYYESEQIPIVLSQTDSVFVDNKLNLITYDQDNNDENFNGVFDGLTYKGQWTRHGKTLDFQLTETYQDGQSEFLMHDFSKVHIENKNFASFGLAFISSTNNEIINDTIRKSLFSVQTSKTDFNKLSNINFEDFVTSYKQDVKELQNGDEGSVFLNYSSFSSYLPILNTNKYTIFEQYDYSYTGGAHGMHGSIFHTYDKSKNKYLSKNDVFSGTDEQLDNLINAFVHKKYKIPMGTKLQEAEGNEIYFITDSIGYTDNFYPTKKGILFYYNVYEVMAYAYGPYQLLIPYEELKPALNPSFQY